MKPKAPTPPPPAPQSSRDKLKDAVNQVMQQVKEGKEQSRADVVRAKAAQTRKQRMRGVQAGVLVLGFIVSSVIGYHLYTEPFPAPSGEEARHEARKALVFAASLINQYQRRTGQLPSTIGQIGVVLPGITYQRSGETYVLSMSIEGQPITYHKDDDPAGFINGR